MSHTAAALSLDEALSRLLAQPWPTPTLETLPLSQALGRVLAQEIIAPVNVPPFDNSAMDGWAYINSPLPADGTLKIVGRVAAGHPFNGTLNPGEAVRIFTGAPVPAGADTVAMQEDCTATDTTVTVPTRLPVGQNIRRAGEDVTAGHVVLKAGVRLRPQHLGLAATVGCTEVTVCRPLRAAVFSTGDELTPPGQPLPPGGIYDSNRATLSALLQKFGLIVTDLGILPDHEDTIATTLSAAARDHDVILTSGGMSVGEEDHVKAAVLRHGSLNFWRLAIRPGRPVAVGQVDQTPFIGLPGNPVAVTVLFLLLARPLLLRLMGAESVPLPRRAVTADFTFTHPLGRREWMRARLVGGPDTPTAVVYPNNSSGVLSSMVWADGLVEIPENVTTVKPGDVVYYTSLEELLA